MDRSFAFQRAGAGWCSVVLDDQDHRTGWPIHHHVAAMYKVQWWQPEPANRRVKE